MRIPALAALAFLSLSVPGRSQDMPQTSRAEPPPAPQVVPPAPAEFVVAGWRFPEDWNFALGPASSPATMSMQLTRRVPGGGVGFSCRRQGGTDEALFVIDGLGRPPGDSLAAELRVGGTAGPLVLVPVPPPEGERDWSLRALGRNAAADILSALAGAGPNTPMVLEVPSLSRSFTVVGPDDPGLAEVAARVCRGWADAAGG